MSRPRGPKLSSSSRVFEKRGDPWMTRREGIKDFSHEALQPFEDPDMDAWLRATKAKERREPGPDKPRKEKSVIADADRRRMNVALSLAAKLRKLK